MFYSLPSETLAAIMWYVLVVLPSNSLLFQNYVRDRLYCAAPGSDEHIAAQYTLHKTGTLLALITSPILPHMSSEFFQHLPYSEENKKVC